MVQNLGVRAAGFLQRGGQFRHSVEDAVVVDGLREGDDVGREPGRINGDRAERDAEDVANQVGLSKQLLDS
jgi:hypothetical protein